MKKTRYDILSVYSQESRAMKTIIIIIAALAVAGCTSTSFRSGQSMDQLSTDQLIHHGNQYAFLQNTVWSGPGKGGEIAAIQNELRARHPDWRWDVISRGAIQRGMSKQEVLISAGQPCGRNILAGSRSSREQWVYGCGRYGSRYVYFTNNKVSELGSTSLYH